jgi:hypothetical protein
MKDISRLGQVLVGRRGRWRRAAKPHAENKRERCNGSSR